MPIFQYLNLQDALYEWSSCYGRANTRILLQPPQKSSAIKPAMQLSPLSTTGQITKLEDKREEKDKKKST